MFFSVKSCVFNHFLGRGMGGIVLRVFLFVWVALVSELCAYCQAKHSCHVSSAMLDESFISERYLLI